MWWWWARAWLRAGTRARTAVRATAAPRRIWAVVMGKSLVVVAQSAKVVARKTRHLRHSCESWAAIVAETGPDCVTAT